MCLDENLGSLRSYRCQELLSWIRSQKTMSRAHCQTQRQPQACWLRVERVLTGSCGAAKWILSGRQNREKKMNSNPNPSTRKGAKIRPLNPTYFSNTDSIFFGGVKSTAVLFAVPRIPDQHALQQTDNRAADSQHPTCVSKTVSSAGDPPGPARVSHLCAMTVSSFPFLVLCLVHVGVVPPKEDGSTWRWWW